MNRNVIGTITDEDPKNHWGFLPVENKVVLDLGCGLNSEFEPTPFYFIQHKKAKLVYGVDPNYNSYQWYKQNYNVHNFILFMDFVDTIQKFEWYIGNVKPDVIKMDVEGSEVLIHAMKPEYLSSVGHIAIEYHSLPALVSCEKLLQENGYIIDYYKFEHLPLDHQGVLYGRKPQNPDEQLNMELKNWKQFELTK